MSPPDLRSHRKESITCESFGLFLIEALKSQDVQATLRQALRPQFDLVVQKTDANMASRLKAMEQELAKKDAEIKKLKDQVEELEDRLDDQEQYSRRTSVRLSGVPEEEGEDCEKKVNDFFSLLDHSPKINRVHRVGKKDSNSVKPRQILCQFTNYPDKKETMKLKQKLKSIKKDVYINEDLTRKRAKLFKLARDIKGEKKIDDVWTADGRIVIKDNNKRIHYLTRISELKW